MDKASWCADEDANAEHFLQFARDHDATGYFLLTVHWREAMEKSGWRKPVPNYF